MVGKDISTPATFKQQILGLKLKIKNISIIIT